MTKSTQRITLALLIMALGASAMVSGRLIAPSIGDFRAFQPGQERPAADAAWGEPVDGLACRLIMQPRYVVGQAISAVIEVKNTSNKRRYIIPQFNMDSVNLEVTGPNGKLEQNKGNGDAVQPSDSEFQPIEPGEVLRFEVTNLGSYFSDLWPHPSCSEAEPQDHPVATGTYTAQFRFRSDKVPTLVGDSYASTKVTSRMIEPAELVAGQWANEALSTKVVFELAPLAKKDLVVHEWGVFTVFNDVKYANVNRKEEWGGMPSFFYRQFPKERLVWSPSAWDKPIMYFYAKPTPMSVTVNVKFTDGAPVVWWPAASSPVDDWPGGQSLKMPRPYRSLVWTAWLGDQIPRLDGGKGPMIKVDDFDFFALPADCWLRHARLPLASRVTVVGNSEDQTRKRFPGSLDRHETESFIYYDGLVPAPDYLRCEKIDGKTVTLRNRAKFDLARLFVVDRRGKDAVGFAFVDGTKQSFKAETSLNIDLERIEARDWPATGIRQVRRALLDAGLFETEAESLLKIWDKGLFQAEGVTVFHILPTVEYDRMLPLKITPEPAAKPVRVGIALHPHVEIEPALVERIGTLIRQLESPKDDQRLAAEKSLLEIGPLAIALLQAELKKGPAEETSRRIRAVLDRVDASVWLNIPAPAKKAK